MKIFWTNGSPVSSALWVVRGIGSRGKATTTRYEMSIPDARCQRESRFFEVSDQELLALADEWLAANERELIQLVALQEEAVSRSESIP